MGEDWPTDTPPYRDGFVHVVREQCSTCVLRSGNLMHLQQGRLKDMLTANLEAGSAYACHQTLGGEHALCKAYVDQYGDRLFVIRLARTLGVIKEVDI